LGIGEGSETNMSESEIGALAWYITFLWVLSMFLIQYWIGREKEEKEANHEEEM
jgi:hypothetical protein